LDEATAAAEAMALAERAAQVKTKSFFVDREVHPQTLAVLRTRAEPLGWNLIVGDPAVDLDKAEVFGGLLQYPGTSGAVRDLHPAIAALRAKGGLVIVAADLLALTLLASPGELGADIAIGSAQRFGVPMGYGGPHAAYMAVRDALNSTSRCPAHVGQSIDLPGSPPIARRCRPASSISAAKRSPTSYRAGAAGGDASIAARHGPGLNIRTRWIPRLRAGGTKAGCRG
jgi:glycine dehydrogenase